MPLAVFICAQEEGCHYGILRTDSVFTFNFDWLLMAFQYRQDGMQDLRCMSFLGKGSSEILVAGYQNVMYKVDVEKGRVVQEVWQVHLRIIGTY